MLFFGQVVTAAQAHEVAREVAGLAPLERIEEDVQGQNAAAREEVGVAAGPVSINAMRGIYVSEGCRKELAAVQARNDIVRAIIAARDEALAAQRDFYDRYEGLGKGEMLKGKLQRKIPGNELCFICLKSRQDLMPKEKLSLLTRCCGKYISRSDFWRLFIRNQENFTKEANSCPQCQHFPLEVNYPDFTVSPNE